ncbi:hypothetical protein N7532_010805 [Penicillium argentinense]|uniref:Uncharacterized protein n=1 Tax=Penicillium argentinense TaxID=1131581 RepID=A0A9W9EQN5_9EURO|nr:uncharacterized protein N7532_010805 [Penicillium argentinense]KAJ5086034.1 hypothetical protein N7532_010805 [Penicillium argentinense]
MAQSRGDNRTFSFNNLLKMLLSPGSSARPTHDEADLGEDLDEPPEQHILHAKPIHPEDGRIFARPTMSERQESLLTRALKSSPEMSPTEPQTPPHDSTYTYRSYPHSNISGISTAELTSDGGQTSPSLSNTPSPPLPSQMMANKKETAPKVKVVNPSETTVEANLGRKRCISFACGRKTDQTPQQKPAAPPAPAPKESEEPTPEPPKRQTTLTFVCPGRQTKTQTPNIQREHSPAHKLAFRSRCRGSPAPISRKTSPPAESSKALEVPTASTTTSSKAVPTSGLGKFEESEATRFHEFASSLDEDDEWVNRATDYKEKITMNDCMKKEIAIRKLGEEAEEEAEDEDDDDLDIADDDSTVHDFSDDDGNESDNEAGFADSDESDDDGDYEFWAPSAAASDSNVPSIEVFPTTMERRASNTSLDSMTDDNQKWLPAPVQRSAGRRSSSSKPKPIKMRPGTPNLPDSTDFVCGTLDEDRPLEAAYKSCMEQRRLSKQVLIPQDIDPSFPTSDPEDNGDLEDISESALDSVVLEPTRGRTDDPTHKTSPRHSPKRIMSPPPPSRRHGRTSPKRLKSPPPRIRAKSPSPEKWNLTEDMPVVDSPRGVNISHLVQRQPLVRTNLERTGRWQGISTLTESPEREQSRTRELLHTRGPIDIVEGLEKKRQKRKEKFWRQHCRKAAKEQMVRRPIPGKGAERMKELGLEVAERCRAYGVGQDAQLVLSV